VSGPVHAAGQRRARRSGQQSDTSDALHCSLAVELQRGVDGSGCDLGVERDYPLAAGIESERHCAFCGCAREVGQLNVEWGGVRWVGLGWVWVNWDQIYDSGGKGQGVAIIAHPISAPGAGLFRSAQL